MDAALVMNQLPLCEIKYIRRALGAPLYNLLKSGQANNTLAGVYKELMKTYIQPCLANYVMYEASPFMAAEPTSAGYTNLTGESYETAPSRAITTTRDKFLKDAELYLEEGIDYILDNNISEYSVDKDPTSNNNYPFIY